LSIDPPGLRGGVAPIERLIVAAAVVVERGGEDWGLADGRTAGLGDGYGRDARKGVSMEGIGGEHCNMVILQNGQSLERSRNEAGMERKSVLGKDMILLCLAR